MAYNFGARLQGMQPGSLYKSFWGGNNAASSPPAGTGGFKPTPTPGATPPITAQGPTMGYAQGSSPVIDNPQTTSTPVRNTGIVPPGTPRMPMTPGMTPGMFNHSGGLNNPSSRMPNPQSTSGTGAGPGSSAPRMGLSDVLSNGMANGWGNASGTPEGNYMEMLAQYGPDQVKAAASPEQWAAIQQYANQQIANANNNYNAGMNDGIFGQGSLAMQRDGALNLYKKFI